MPLVSSSLVFHGTHLPKIFLKNYFVLLHVDIAGHESENSLCC
jgi:hypothetical protein